MSGAPKTIRIKGKYLKAIEDYVATLDLNDPAFFKENDEYQTLKEAILKLHGSFLSEANIFSIVFDETLTYAYQARQTDNPTELPPDFREELIQRLKVCIESFPRQYTVRIELPSIPTWGDFRIPISESLFLVSAKTLIHKGENRLAYLLREPSEALCLEIHVAGYADSAPDSPGTADAIALAKQFAFISTSLGIFKRTFTSAQKANAEITTQINNKVHSINFPDSLSRCFGELHLNEALLQVTDDSPEGKARGLLFQGTRAAVTPEEKTKGLNTLIYDASKFFAHSGYPDFPSIAAAIEWYLDSLFADNQTFSYLAACIGLEALLGSNEQLDSLSKRLADRYAFLIGTTRTEREQLIEDYRKLLDLRGELVHAKRARLNSESQQSLWKIQEMLFNAIWHEIRSMYKNSKKS